MSIRMLKLVVSVILVSLVVAGSRLNAAESTASRKPNVVIILADDQGWGDLSVHGNKNLSTPQIDSLARDGALFERFFVCPVCAPTRAEFLTGRYHSRGGVRGVSLGQERLNLDEKTLADHLKSAGYATGIFGKWHNGTQYPYHPIGRGFQEFYGYTSGHWGQYFDAPMEHNSEYVQGKGYINDDLTDHAMAFITQHQADSFLCYLPLATPHSPFMVPDEYWNRFADPAIVMRSVLGDKEDIAKTRSVLAMVENIDWNVGRVLKKLDELKLTENAVVIYFSDNGPNTQRWNGGMKGIKASTDEGGVRVPFLIRWPGHIPAGMRVLKIAGAIDLLPTIAAMTQTPLGEHKPLDGVDLSPLLTGRPVDWADRTIFTHQSNKFSARTQQYRLDAAGALYDMEKDPSQKKNISSQQPEVAKKLGDQVMEFRKIVPKDADDRPYLVGYREFPVTYLPARDGVPHGNVARSAKAPNCSYFTKWIDPSDSITWDVQVNTPGEYEVILHYTCGKDDLGSTVEVAFLNSTVEGKITVANDPPLWDKQDRVPRDQESYIKAFKPMTLGTIHLQAGHDKLTVRAKQIAGKQVMDLSMIQLKLK